LWGILMSESEDDSSKTEEPSQKKLDEARKKGQIPATRELYHFTMMGSFLFFILLLGPKTGHDTMNFLTPFIAAPDQFDMGSGGVVQIMHKATFGLLLVLMLPFLLTLVMALAPAIIQNKIVFSSEHIKPKLSKISPLSGFGRLFGLKAIIEFLKNLLKVFAIGAISFMVVMPYRNQLPELLHSSSKSGMLVYSQTIAGKILIGACIFLFSCRSPIISTSDSLS